MTSLAARQWWQRAQVAKSRGVVLMGFASVFFALMAVCARAASVQMSSPQLATIRFAVCTAALLGAWSAGHARLRPHNLRLLTFRGVIGGLSVLLYFLAIARCRDASTATLLNFTSPIFAHVFARSFLRESTSLRFVFGTLVATVGVTLVLWKPEAMGIAPGLGEGAGLASAVLSGLAMVVIRASRKTDDATTILFAFSLVGLLISIPFAASTWQSASAAIWLIALLMGGCSLVAQFLMTYAFGLLPASQGALCQQLTPAFTLLFATLLLGEIPTLRAVVGMGLTLVAVLYAAVPSERFATPPEAARQSARR